MSFKAKYVGWCQDCDDRIHLDEEINYSDDEALVHVDCHESAGTPARIADICGKCWLTKPCDCEAAA